MRTYAKTIVTATILLSFCFAAFSQQVAKSIPNSTSPDGLIGFLQFTPRDYGSQKHPLIIFLHGIGERGNGTSQIASVANNGTPNYCANGATMRFTVAGVTSSFVVLSPQLSTSYGYWPTFYVKEMIKYAKANLMIDTNRIYVTGLSLGGGGIWRLITDTQNFDHTFDGTIAAAAPVCGTQEETDADFCTTIGTNHLPVWAFHSMDDGTVGVGATQHAEILGNMCGNFNPAMKFTYYQSGGHGGAWIHAYDTGHITVPVVVNGVVSNFTATPNLYEWFLGYNRGTTVQPLITNTVPVAAAGNAQTITLPTSIVSLSGSGTGTNGATISSYAWLKTSGPPSGTIANVSAASTSVSGLAQGTYVFTLTVTDNHGLTSSSSVTVTVNPAVITQVIANQAPSANAGANQTITLPTSTTTLTAAGSKDPDGSITGYWWTVTSGPSLLTLGTRSAVTTTVSGLVAGTYTFALQVTDNGGLTAWSGVTITVNAATVSAPVNQPNQYPSANAGINQTISLPVSTITLNGTGSYDTDGSIASYWWTQTGGPAGPVMATRNAATSVVTGLTAGTYTFVLGVTDNGGLTGYSSMTLTVNAAASAPVNTGNLLGYVKISTGPYQACDDASATGRTALYGNAIANGSILYTDAAMTQIYNGGWNWFSFKPVLGGATTYAFAIYPNGAIGLLRNCSTGTSVRTAAPGTTNTTTAEQDIATLKQMKDSATAASSMLVVKDNKLSIFPNPVRTNATIELNSADNGVKTINVYNSGGILVAKYVWQTVKGNNVYALKNVSGFTNGLYIIDVRDNTGKPVASVKFLKM